MCIRDRPEREVTSSGAAVTGTITRYIHRKFTIFVMLGGVIAHQGMASISLHSYACFRIQALQLSRRQRPVMDTSPLVATTPGAEAVLLRFRKVGESLLERGYHQHARG